MGRAPCCDKANVKKGPWSPEEDTKLKEYIENYGTGGNWIALPQKAGLRRCGKSCRLRWLNYLRPNIKHGEFTDEEDRMICSLYATIGSRWSIIAAQLPGRTDNDIKNYWNTKLKKKLMGLVPNSHKKPPLFPCSQESTTSSSLTPSSSCNPFYIPRTSFLGLESSMSLSSNLLSNSNCMGPIISSSFVNSHDSLIMSSTMHYNYHTTDNNITAFPNGNEASCSQISSFYGRDIKQEYHHMGLKSYDNDNSMSNGFDQESQRFVLGYVNSGCDQNVGPCPNGFLDQIPLEYDLGNVMNQVGSGNVGAPYESFFFHNHNYVEEN